MQPHLPMLYVMLLSQPVENEPSLVIRILQFLQRHGNDNSTEIPYPVERCEYNFGEPFMHHPVVCWNGVCVGIISHQMSENQKVSAIGEMPPEIRICDWAYHRPNGKDKHASEEEGGGTSNGIEPA